MIFGWIVIVIAMISVTALMVDLLSWDSRPDELKLDRWERLANQVEIEAYEYAQRKKEMAYRTVYYTA